MKIGHKKELKIIAEENYCTEEPYSFMLVDTRSTARVSFKKNFNEPINL